MVSITKSVWVILQYDDEVLLLKRSKKSNNPKLWNFPGGGIEKNETAKKSAVREVKEEAGIDIKVQDLIFTERQVTNERVMYFYTVFLERKPDVKLNKESSDFKWLKWEDFPAKLHKPTKRFVQVRERKSEVSSTGGNLFDLVRNLVDSINRK